LFELVYPYTGALPTHGVFLSGSACLFVEAIRSGVTGFNLSASMIHPWLLSPVVALCVKNVLHVAHAGYEIVVKFLVFASQIEVQLIEMLGRLKSQ
jgi:hypothetical protein